MVFYVIKKKRGKPYSYLVESVRVKGEKYCKKITKYLRKGELTKEEVKKAIEQNKEFFENKKKELLRIESEKKDNIFFGIKDELNQGLNAIAILKARYLLRDEKGNLIETPKQMFRRVANCIAKADEKYGGDVKKIEEEFYEILCNLEFIPNSPTLMNASAPLGQLSACFIMGINDSLESIFGTLRDSSLIMQSGGGIGFNFSHLRPEGDIVRSTAGVASGVVSFARIYDVATEVIKAGGKRRGAMMGILNVDHPDIKEFIIAKSKEGVLTNFNLSIGVFDNFMENIKKNKEYWLVNPRNNKKIEKINAKKIFDLITEKAWEHGDPGLVFLDEINRYNRAPALGKIETVNPCAEVVGLNGESCVLGSINLSKVVDGNKINWEKLKELTRLGIHFLDNVIEVNKFPLKKIEEMTKSNRRIGLGLMSWADLLVKLKIPYNSKGALELAEKLMKFINLEAIKASVELAKKRGSFPNFNKSILKNKFKKIRNIALTSIAPTGTISIIAGGVSSGIEPLFSICYFRRILGQEFLEINKEFERIAKERGFYSKELMKKIAKTGSVQNIKGVPKDIKKIFVTALDIKPEWHVKMQATFQRYTENAVSKTVNLPKDATVDDVRKIYLLAYKLKCKGITIYRYGSKKGQILNIGKIVKVHPEYAGGCPYRRCLF